jgi:hypothetical protein
MITGICKNAIATIIVPICLPALHSVIASQMANNSHGGATYFSTGRTINANGRLFRVLNAPVNRDLRRDIDKKTIMVPTKIDVPEPTKIIGHAALAKKIVHTKVHIGEKIRRAYPTRESHFV